MHFLKIDQEQQFYTLVGHPEPEKKLLAFLVHFGIYANSVPWCVLRRIGVDAKSGNAPKDSELGQRSTKCKFLYLHQILEFLSIKYLNYE